MKIYFAHPVSTFGTELEADCINAINAFFPDAEVINPADPVHKEHYETRKQETGNGMQYYVEDVLPDIDIGVFLPFEDGQYGAGKALEAEHLAELYRITRDQDIYPTTEDAILGNALTIDETKDRLD